MTFKTDDYYLKKENYTCPYVDDVINFLNQFRDVSGIEHNVGKCIDNLERVRTIAENLRRYAEESDDLKSLIKAQETKIEYLEDQNDDLKSELQYLKDEFNNYKQSNFNSREE